MCLVMKKRNNNNKKFNRRKTYRDVCIMYTVYQYSISTRDDSSSFYIPILCYACIMDTLYTFELLIFYTFKVESSSNVTSMIKLH